MVCHSLQCHHCLLRHFRALGHLTQWFPTFWVLSPSILFCKQFWSHVASKLSEIYHSRQLSEQLIAKSRILSHYSVSKAEISVRNLEIFTTYVLGIQPLTCCSKLVYHTMLKSTRLTIYSTLAFFLVPLGPSLSPVTGTGPGGWEPLSPNVF